MSRRDTPRRIAFLCALLFALPAAAAELPRASLIEQGFDPALAENLHAAMQRHVDAKIIPGAQMLVARHGSIVLEDRVGVRTMETGAPIEGDTIFRLFSSTKVFTAAAVLMLVDDGVLKLDEPVATYMPEFNKLRVWVSGEGEAMVTEPLTRPMTVRDLMAHRGGFTYGAFGGSPVHQLLRERQMNQGPSGTNATSLDDFITRLVTVPLLFQPGTRWEYSVSSDVLGALIQRVTGLPFADFMQQRLFTPLDMKDTSFTVPEEKRARQATVYRLQDGVLVDRARTQTQPNARPGATATSGNPMPSGGAGLNSTVRDFARFAVMMCNGGELDGKRFLKADTVASINVNQVPAGGPNYGLGVGIEVDPNNVKTRGSLGSYGWSGAGQVHFWVDPKEQIVGIFLTQVTPFTLDRDTEMRTLVYGALRTPHS